MRRRRCWPRAASPCSSRSAPPARQPGSPPCWRGCPPCRRWSGGATRQASVRAGLELLARRDPPPVAVLVHDAARPVVPSGTIPALLAALREAPGAIPAQPVADTLKRGADGLVRETVPRAGLYRAQTPQAFRFDALLAAHRAAVAEATDDAQLMELSGAAVRAGPRIGDECEDHLSRGSRPGCGADGAAAAATDRHRLRRAPDRAWPAHGAVRRAGALRIRAGGPFGRRCRHPCALRRDLRGAGGRRYRPLVPAERDAMAGRRQRPVPAAMRRPGSRRGAG